MMAKLNSLIALFALVTCSPPIWAANPQSWIPDSSHAVMHPDLIFVGENSDWKLYYDKNITYETPRKQATVYLLIEAKTPRDYTYQEPTGHTKTYQYRYMVQRSDMDCNRGIYVADRVTYFEEGSGKIIQESVSGTPYKVGPGSLIEKVYARICAEM